MRQQKINQVTRWQAYKMIAENLLGLLEFEDEDGSLFIEDFLMYDWTSLEKWTDAELKDFLPPQTIIRPKK